MKPTDEDSIESSSKTFLEHLVDLRDTIVRSLIALIIGMAVAITLAPRIYDLLALPLEKAGRNPKEFLQLYTVMGSFNLAMLIVLLSGLLIGAPFIVFFIAKFVFPGLTKKERRAVVTYGMAAVLLFMAGVLLGYFFALPVALKIMIEIGGWIGPSVKWLDAGDYVIFCLFVLLGFGLSFELPVVIVLLGHLGLVDSSQLRSARSYAVVLILIVAMFITPDTSCFSQLVMAVPMIAMYEISIWIVWLKERRAG